MKHVSIKNNQTILIFDIPELDYVTFLEQNIFSLIKNKECHCVSYFGYPYKDKIKLICCIANDASGSIYVSSSLVSNTQRLPSFLKSLKEKFTKILEYIIRTIPGLNH